MKYLFITSLVFVLGLHLHADAQELFVFTEPASNMAAKSIGLRLTNEDMLNSGSTYRTIPEVMVSFNKHLMMHGQAFLSDFDGNYRLEGGSVYAKYRFLSIDDSQRHFRASAFGRLSTSDRPTYTEDINLEGDNSGAQAGLVVTQLLHKLALSGSLSYIKAFDPQSRRLSGMPQPDQLISYSLSIDRAAAFRSTCGSADQKP